MTLVFTIVTLVAWFGGYLSASGVISTRVNSQHQEKIISPPVWLYYICGAPISKKYPRGTMSATAFRAQITGIGLGLFTMAINIWHLSKTELIIGLGLSAVVPLLIWAYVSKNYLIKVRKEHRRSRE